MSAKHKVALPTYGQTEMPYRREGVSGISVGVALGSGLALVMTAAILLVGGNSGITPAATADAGHAVTDDPKTIAREYFARVKASNPRVVDLFHDDAQLLGLGTVRSGRSEIEAFYRKTLQQSKPSPQLVEPLLGEGSRVAAEILIDVSAGAKVHALDLFEIEDGRIRSLTYFIADYPRGPGSP